MSKRIVSFESFEDLTRLKRVHAAFNLTVACKNTLDIEANHPLAANNYRNALTAYQRIGYISRLVDEGKMRANIINYTGQLVGVSSVLPAEAPADAQMLQSASIAISEATTHVEIDFWASRVNGGNQSVAQATVDHLGKEAQEFVGGLGGDDALLWHLTPESGELEKIACRKAGMVPVGGLEVYDIGDRVALPRMLWVKHVAVLG